MGFINKKDGVILAMVVAATMEGSVRAAVPGLKPEQTVVHSSIVFRHGERSRLAKSGASEFGVNAGVTLTPRGEWQGYLLGKSLRHRYIQAPKADGVTTIINGIEVYDSDRVQMASSGYDRTLETAEAVALGLYPPDMVDEGNSTWLPNNHVIIPVHSLDPENDAIILAHDVCPVYTDNWQEFYRTSEFEDKESEASAWIMELYRMFTSENGAGGAGSVPCYAEVKAFNEFKLKMHAPYNLWDCAMVLEHAGQPYAINQIDITPPPSDVTNAKTSFEYLEYLVYWIEDKKYTRDRAGRMLGGLYLTHMVKRWDQVMTYIHSGHNGEVGRYPGLHLTAAHYPTLKGIEAALGIGNIAGVPEPTSHLAFELIQNTSANMLKGEEDFSVRMLYQEGSDESTLQVVQLGQIWAADDDNLSDDIDYNNRLRDDMPWSVWTYVLENILPNGKPVLYENDEDWCDDCRTESVDTCVKIELQDMTANWEDAVATNHETVAQYNENASDDVKGFHVALFSIFGILIGMSCGFFARPCLVRLNEQAKGELSITDNQGLEGWGGLGGGGNTNGVFRLGGGAKRTPARHLPLGDHRAMGAHTVGDDETSGSTSGDAEMGDPSRIPAFASTSSLGEPVPFPHRGPPSATLRSVKTPLSPAGDGGTNGNYLVSPVPESNGHENGFAEKAMAPTTDGGGSWDVNANQETWGGEDDTTEINGAPYN